MTGVICIRDWSEIELKFTETIGEEKSKSATQSNRLKLKRKQWL